MIPYRKIRGNDESLTGRVDDLERQIGSIMEIDESNILNLEKMIKRLNDKTEELLARVETLSQIGE